MTVLLLQVFWQDVKTRTLNLAVLAVIVCLVIGSRLISVSIVQYAIDVCLNLLWIGTHLLVLTAYLSVRRKAFTVPVGAFMGLGDVAFWLAPALFFAPEKFVFFWIASTVFALAAHGCLRVALKKTYMSTIPLAGFQALWMAATLVTIAPSVR